MKTAQERAAQYAAQTATVYAESYTQTTTPSAEAYQLYNLAKGKPTDKVLVKGADNVIKEINPYELVEEQSPDVDFLIDLNNGYNADLQ